MMSKDIRIHHLVNMTNIYHRVDVEIVLFIAENIQNNNLDFILVEQKLKKH